MVWLFPAAACLPPQLADRAAAAPLAASAAHVARPKAELSQGVFLKDSRTLKKYVHAIQHFNSNILGYFQWVLFIYICRIFTIETAFYSFLSLAVNWISSNVFVSIFCHMNCALVS